MSSLNCEVIALAVVVALVAEKAVRDMSEGWIEPPDGDDTNSTCPSSHP